MSSPVGAGPDAMVPGCMGASRRPHRSRHRRRRPQSLVLVVASIVVLVSLLVSAILVLENDGSSHRVGTTGMIDVTSGIGR